MIGTHGVNQSFKLCSLSALTSEVLARKPRCPARHLPFFFIFDEAENHPHYRFLSADQAVVNLFAKSS